MNNLFPWCKEIWAQLIAADKQQRFPHALLFFGNAGLGKKEFAQQLAQYLLCSNAHKRDFSCGECKDCQLFIAGTHGDFYQISPENNKSLGIDEIRSIKENSYQSSQRGMLKVFVIAPADKMTVAAANALLKVLEEPSSDSIFILISERKNALSSTILSRCQHISFPQPSVEMSEYWLLSDTHFSFSKEEIKNALYWSLGSPILAKEMLLNKTVEIYQTYSNQLLDYFSKKISLFDIIKLWQNKPLADILLVAQMTCYEELKFCKLNLKKDFLYQWVEKIIKVKKMLSTKVALNEALLLEFLLGNF